LVNILDDKGEIHVALVPHNIMAFAKHLLVVGCLCRFALRTRQGITLECAKGQ